MPRSSPSQRLGLFVILALFAGVYGRYLIGYAPSGGDIVNQYLPYQELVRNSVRQGVAPLWNGMTFCGRPLMGDIQVGVLYPPNWLHWVLPLQVSFAFLLAAHAAWMMIGCWLLARRWGLHPAAAALGAVLFAGSPFFTLKMSQGVILFIYVGAWWPWLALATARLVERPNATRMIVLGLTLTLSLLAGSPQITFYGWIATLVLGLALPSDQQGGKAWFGRAGLIACAFVFATALTAIQTFQSYHFVSNSFERGAGAGWDYITDGSLAPRVLWLLLNPGYLGIGESATEYFWAYPPDFAESCYYLPLWALAMLLPLALAVIIRKDSSPLHRRLAILAVIAIVLGVALALGRSSPLFALFYKIVPGFNRFRVPARLMLFYTAGFSVLAALAYDRLLTIRPHRAGRVILAGLVFALAAVWVSYALRLQIWEAAGYPYAKGGVVQVAEAHRIVSMHALAMAARVSAFLLIAAGALIQARRRPSHAMAFLVPLLAAAELAWFAWPYQSPADPFKSSARVADYRSEFYPQTDLVKVLQGEIQRGGGRVLWLDDVNIWALDQNQPEIYPNRMIMHGLPEARGYDPVNAKWIGRWMNLLSGKNPNETPGGFMFVGRIARPAWLTLMGVSTVLSYDDLTYIPGLKPIARLKFPIPPDVGPQYYRSIPGLFIDPATNQPMAMLTVWHNEQFRGMAFTAPMPKIAENPDEALFGSVQLADTATTSPTQAIVTDKNFLANRIWPVAKIDDRFTVRPLESNPNEYRYEVNYPDPALLCLAQSRWDGWMARVDDSPAAISTLNGTFMAIAVPAGHHQVVFEFHPEGLVGGMWITIAAIVMMLYLLARRLVVNRKH